MRGLAAAVVLIVSVLLVGWCWVYQRYETAQKTAQDLCRKGRYTEARDVIAEYQSRYVSYPVLNFGALNVFAQRLAYTRGVVNAGLGVAADAEAEFGRASEASESGIASAALYNRTPYLLERGELESAVEQYRKALSLTPGDVQTQINLELLLEKVQQQGRGAQEQRNGKDMVPAQPDVWSRDTSKKDNPSSADSKRIWR